MPAIAFPDVKHLKNLKIEENREYLPPLAEAPTNTIESSTGYDYPRPAIPFPNEIETIQQTKPQKNTQKQPKLISSPTNIFPVRVHKIAPTQTPFRADNLPITFSNTHRSSLVSTGAETRIVSTTVKPFQKDYLPPRKDGAETRINFNIIPSPETKLPTNEYLPPTTPTRTTTQRSTTESYPSSYAPAANTPIPSVVKPQGPYYTKFDEENGYDYSKPAVGFDLPNNRVPVLNSADPDDDDDDENYASASAPTNNVPVYTPSTSTTTEESPPAPDVIYTPSHTLDEDGYRYKVPNKPFNY